MLIIFPHARYKICISPVEGPMTLMHNFELFPNASMRKVHFFDPKILFIKLNILFNFINKVDNIPPTLTNPQKSRKC